MKYEDITIIRDTREKDGHGWFFEPDEKKSGPPRIAKTIIDTLQMGDYSLGNSGMENLVRIERKAGFSELMGNMLESERFEREMEKFASIKYKYMFVETVISKDILSLSIHQMRYPVPIKKLHEWIVSLELKYNLHTKFVGDAGAILAKQLLKLVAKEHFQNLYDSKMKVEGNE